MGQMSCRVNQRLLTGGLPSDLFLHRHECKCTQKFDECTVEAWHIRNSFCDFEMTEETAVLVASLAFPTLFHSSSLAHFRGHINTVPTNAGSASVPR